VKVTRNEDGTVTVLVKQAPEVYDPAEGALYVPETMSADEFKAAIAKPKAKPETEPVA
jgi:hypothetical protein